MGEPLRPPRPLTSTGRHRRLRTGPDSGRARAPPDLRDPDETRASPTGPPASGRPRPDGKRSKAGARPLRSTPAAHASRGPPNLQAPDKTPPPRPGPRPPDDPARTASGPRRAGNPRAPPRPPTPRGVPRTCKPRTKPRLPDRAPGLRATPPGRRAAQGGRATLALHPGRPRLAGSATRSGGSACAAPFTRFVRRLPAHATSPGPGARLRDGPRGPGPDPRARHGGPASPSGPQAQDDTPQLRGRALAQASPPGPVPSMPGPGLGSAPRIPDRARGQDYTPRRSPRGPGPLGSGRSPRPRTGPQAPGRTPVCPGPARGVRTGLLGGTSRPAPAPSGGTRHPDRTTSRVARHPETSP